MVSIVNNGATIDIVNYRQSGTTATIIKANVTQVLVVGGNVIIKEAKNNGTATYDIVPSTVTSPTTYANGNILQAYISSILNQSTTGVLSWSAGATGLTPNVATSGNVTLGGVLLPTHGGTGLAAVVVGDLMYGTAVDTWGILPVGLNGEVLTLVAGVPVWVAPTAGVTNVTATTPITSTGGATPNISTSMNTSRLIGRTTAGVGVMEEISIGAGLSLAAGVLSATAASVALSAITAATATNTIDNLNFNQTWNFSTLSTQTAFDYNANAITTGSILRLHTSSGVLNSTDGLLHVHNSGVATSGVLARFQSNSTVGSGLTVLASSHVTIGTTTNSAANTYLTVLNNTTSPRISVSTTLTSVTASGYDFYSGATFKGGFTRDNSNDNLQWATAAGGGTVMMTLNSATGYLGLGKIATTAVDVERALAGSLHFAIRNTTNTGSSGLYVTENTGVEYSTFKRFGSAFATTYLRNSTSAGGDNGASGVAHKMLFFSTSATAGSSYEWHFTATPSAATRKLQFVEDGNLLIATTASAAGTSATKTFVVENGTAPAGNVTDSFQLYSADTVAGNATPHFRTENGSIINLYEETNAVAAAAFVTNTSGIVNDTATWGGYTAGQVVQALQNHGLLQ